MVCYHIDLLIVRARLHLLTGHTDKALDDIQLALGDENGEGGGIEANDETGQPELLAARHPACGYAWPVPEGLQLKAEALLLQAAQEMISVGWASPTNDGMLDAIDLEPVGSAHPTIGDLINEAKSLLEEALSLWQPLHDPEPERDDQNFKLNGKEYNYKAAATYRVITDLEGGRLTRHPIEPLPESKAAEAAATGPWIEESEMPNFDVFLSHNSKDKATVRKLKKKLEDDNSLSCWLDEDELPPGVPWQPVLEKGIRDSKSVAVLVGNDGEGPWQAEETMAALELAVREQLPVIPVLLPSAPSQPDLPMFLANRGWVDLRGGLKKDDVDKLVWGITGSKPNPTGETQPVAEPPSKTPAKPAGKTLPPTVDTGESGMNQCDILLFAANPAGTGQLALDEEVREIEAKIRTAEHRENLKLISKWAVRPDDLLQALNQHDAGIVHFSGHGSESEEIILKSDQGDPQAVSKAALSALFKTLRGNIQLVILNACFSEPQADAITEHVDCAIGMTKAIGDKAAITFAASVYRAIGFGKSVQDAFDQGITALLLEGIPEENTPRLICRDNVDAKEVFVLNP